jgi:hypothetical protein
MHSLLRRRRDAPDSATFIQEGDPAMIRTSIAAAALVLATAATPSFAGPYDNNDDPSQYGAYGRHNDGVTFDQTTDSDNCHRHVRWGSYGRRIVRRTYDGRNYGTYNGTNYGTNYGSNYGRRNDY